MKEIYQKGIKLIIKNDKHLEFKSGLETTSIQYYAEYGKVSGSMYLNVKRLCEEYASQQLAEKDKEIERLKKALTIIERDTTDEYSCMTARDSLNK